MTGALGSPKKIASGRGVVKLDYKTKKNLPVVSRENVMLCRWRSETRKFDQFS